MMLELFRIGMDHGGAISGEHGLGTHQEQVLARARGPHQGRAHAPDQGGLRPQRHPQPHRDLRRRALLDHLRERAAAERLPIETRTEDAEALNVPDDSFDAVLSTFGVSFTPNQERAASELVRVCRPGGRIGLANWTPDSFVGHMLRTIGTYVPPPTGVRSPLEWGTDARLVELFGDQVADLQVTEREFVFRFRSPAHFVEVFRTYYGPLVMALETLDDEGRAALQADLVELARRSDTARAGGLRLPSAYLEVVATTAS
jgi:SAM-dependent methyltransferase